MRTRFPSQKPLIALHTRRRGASCGGRELILRAGFTVFHSSWSSILPYDQVFWSGLVRACSGGARGVVFVCGGFGGSCWGAVWGGCAGCWCAAWGWGWFGYTAKLQLAVAGSRQTVRSASGTSVVFSGLVSSTRYYIGVHSNVGGVAQYYSGVYCTTAVGPPWCGAVSASGVQLRWRSDSRVHQWYAARATAGSRYVDGRLLAGSALSTVFTGLAANVSYTFFFWWRASATSAWIQVHPSAVCATAAPPGAPVVSCAATASTVSVSWGAARGAVRYRVSRGSGWAASSGRSHVFSNLAASTAYAVRVQGWNTAGWGQTGTAACTTLASVLPAPAGLECEATSGEIRFSWDPVTGADSYTAKIQLAKPGSAQTQKATGSTTVAFTGLAASTRYWVSVLAVKNGSPQRFAGVYCTTLADIAAPSLSCRATSDKVTVTWPAVKGASKYRARVNSGAWSGGFTAASRVFSGLTAGKVYTVTVQSGGAKGWGNAANVRCVTAAAGVDCDDTTSVSVVVEWDPVDGARRWFAAISVGNRRIGAKSVSQGNTAEFTGLAKATRYVVSLWWLGDGGKWNKVSPSPECWTKHLDTPKVTGHTTGGNTLTIQWAPVEGAQLYQARISAAGTSGAVGASGGGWETVLYAGTSHTFTGLEPGTQYTVELRAGTFTKVSEASVHGTAYQPESGQTSRTPTTSTVECKANTAATIDVEWKDPRSEYQWRVARTVIDQNGNIQHLSPQTFAKGTTEAKLAGLEPNTFHWISVWNRADSQQSWQPIEPAPHCYTSPSDLAIRQCPQTADTDGTVRWTPNGATYYRITRNRNQAKPRWTTTNTTSHTFTGLAEDTTCKIGVQAWTPKGWTTSATCNMTTLPPIPNRLITGTGKYFFTEGTVKGVLYAAETAITNYSNSPSNTWATCKATIDKIKLAAIMLMIPVHELMEGESQSYAPSPMTLSRWDHLGRQKQMHTATVGGVEVKQEESINVRMFSHMETNGYPNAHWSPGVGLWQLDPWEDTKRFNHAERADIRIGGVEVGEYLLEMHCKNTSDYGGLEVALDIWSACKSDTSFDQCLMTYIGQPTSIYQGGKLNIHLLNSMGQVEGGIRERSCRWNLNKSEFKCYLYDLAIAEANPSDYNYTIYKVTETSDGETIQTEEVDWTLSATPVSMAFISFTDPITETRFAVWSKDWPASNSYQYWPSNVVSKDKSIYRAVVQNEVVRCSPGRDTSPESKNPKLAAIDCAEEMYKPFGDKIENHNFSNGSTIIEGWYDNSVPYRNGGTGDDRHRLQVEHCEDFVLFSNPIVICKWIAM